MKTSAARSPPHASELPIEPLRGSPRKSRSRLLSALRRSLAIKAALLLIAVAASTTAVVGWLAAKRMSARFVAEIDRRGVSLSELLERHKDLHAAALDRNQELAGDILSALVRNDEDIAYLALLDAGGHLLAAATAVEGEDAAARLKRESAHHPLDTPGLADSDAAVRRFTQPVAADAGESGSFAAGAAEHLYSPGATIAYVLVGMRAGRFHALAAAQAVGTVSAVAVALLVAFFGFFLRLSRRIGRMVRFADKLAAGDLQAGLAESSPDELGQLAGSLRALSSSTRGLLFELAAAAESLRASSRTVLEGAQSQRARAFEQAERMEALETTVAELRHAAQAARTDAETVIAGAEVSARRARGGRGAVEANIAAVGALRGGVEAMLRDLQRLVEQGEQVKALVEHAREVAEQSNVLALNAGLEASRTGSEAFGVLAREMRTLAEQSKRAATEANATLRGIAAAAIATRVNAAEGMNRSQDAVQRASGAGEAIGELAVDVERFASSAIRIVASSQAQAEAIEQLWARTSDTREEAARVAEEASACERTSSRIEADANQLQAIVARFRLAGS